MPAPDHQPSKRRVPRSTGTEGIGQVTSIRLRPEVRLAVESLAPDATLGFVINEALSEWIKARTSNAGAR